MFDVTEIYAKCEEADLRNVYVGFKEDARIRRLLLLRLSCDHPSGQGRVYQQAVYDCYTWPFMVNSVIAKLQKLTKEPYKCNGT